MTDPADLHQAWVNHFDSLGQSQANKHHSVKLLESELTHLSGVSRNDTRGVQTCRIEDMRMSVAHGCYI